MTMYSEKTYIWRTLLVALMLIFYGTISAQKKVAVRNNFVYDISGTLNMGVDVRTSQHWTIGLTGGYRPWPTDDKTTRKWKHLLIAPELRYWTDSTFHKGYWGTNLIYSHYNVGHVTFPFVLYKKARDHRFEGDLIAIGLFYGRSWRVNRWLRLEGELGMAAGWTWYKKYDCNHCGTYYGKEDKPVFIPKVTLNLVYQKIEKKQPEPPIIITPIDTTPPPPPALAVHPVPDNTGRAGALQKDNPVLEHISQYRPYDRTRVMRKERGALYVHFPLDKSTLLHDFRDNGPTLDRIVSITSQVLADSTSDVRRIQIVGLASIEGGVAHNEQLSSDRADALKRYIQQQVPQATDNLFDVAAGGEAWAELRDQLNDIVMGTAGPDGVPTEADGARRAELRDAIGLIDSEADLTRREQRLRQMNGGRTYAYIKQHLLADQRNSGYLRIYYDYVPDTAAATINEASQLIQQERYAEALTQLRTVQNDPRSWNALGVALWHTGSHDAAIDYFRRAAQQGNSDARENLRLLNK